MSTLLNTPVRVVLDGTAQDTPVEIISAAPVRQLFAVTVASGQQRSSAASLGSLTAIGFVIPATISVTAVRFERSMDGTTFYPVYKDDNSILSYTVATGEARSFDLDPSKFYAWPYVRLFLNTTEGGNRTYQIVAVGL